MHLVGKVLFLSILLKMICKAIGSVAEVVCKAIEKVIVNVDLSLITIMLIIVSSMIRLESTSFWDSFKTISNLLGSCVETFVKHFILLLLLLTFGCSKC